MVVEIVARADRVFREALAAADGVVGHLLAADPEGGGPFAGVDAQEGEPVVTLGPDAAVLVLVLGGGRDVLVDLVAAPEVQRQDGMRLEEALGVGEPHDQAGPGQSRLRAFDRLDLQVTKLV